MEWKKILRLDGFKSLIMLICAIFPHSLTTYGDELLTMGFPFQSVFIDWNFVGNEVHKAAFSSVNFIGNLIIGYIVAVIIVLIYYQIKKK